MEDLMRVRFRLEYDDNADDAAMKISGYLKQFGLTIEMMEGDFDGYQMYEIVELPEIDLPAKY